MVDKPEGVKEEEVKPQGESPTQENTSEEVEEPKMEVATEDAGTKTETEESTGKGANQRIRELNREKKEAVEKAQKAEEEKQSLADRLAEITSPLGLSGQQTPYTPQVEPGQEISPEQYQGDVTKTARGLVQIEIAQNNAVNRINNEATDVLRKYPQLDPDSDSFDEELSDTVTEITEAAVRANPYSAPVSKLVDKLMKPYTGSVAKEVGKHTEQIAKQVSDAALRPTSVRKGEKDAGEKSIAELEQELGIVQT